LAYFYIRDTLSDEINFQKNDLWHFLLAFVVLITLLPHIFSTMDHKRFIAEQIFADRTFLSSYKPTLFYDLIGVKGIYLIRPIQTLIYIFFGLNVYAKKLHTSNNAIFQTQRKVISRWLIVFIFFLVLVCVTQMTIYEEAGVKNRFDTDLTARIMLYLTMIGIIGLLISPFIFPSILYGLPVLKHKSFLIRFKAPNDEAKANFEDMASKNNTSNHLMEGFYIKSMEQKIEKCMLNEKPFLKNDFNLSMLSTMINIPLHHLGYYFREVRQTTFTEMRNEYRVKYAVFLMESGELSHFTLETIGIQSGFETRNTFRIAFKKVYGMTPSEFVEHLK
jgi:AraC-like DNA-binding protein